MKNWNSMSFKRKTVIGMFIAALVYVVVDLVIFCIKGSEPDTLTQNVFTFLSVEGGVLGAIKFGQSRSKSKGGNENGEDSI